MPTAVRGRAIMTLSFFWAVGAVFLAFLAWAVMPTLGWRYLVALSTLPMITFLLIGPKFMPESPLYLAATGQKSRVMDQLNKVNTYYRYRSHFGAFCLPDSFYARAEQ